jgi:hypothetical protein
LAAQKIGLLQSKRMYPENNDVVDDDPVNFLYGMNKFLHRDPNSPMGKIHRQYEFTEDSKYAALKAGANQVHEMERLNELFGEAVYYLFYNPPIVPTSIRYPVVAHQSIVHPPLGCRVYRASDVHPVLSTLSDGQSPSLKNLESSSPSSNWRLEDWTEFLLRCKVGQTFGPDKEQLMSSLVERRSGPIGAAIAVSIALPEG